MTIMHLPAGGVFANGGNGIAPVNSVLYGEGGVVIIDSGQSASSLGPLTF